MVIFGGNTENNMNAKGGARHADTDNESNNLDVGCD